MILFIKLTSIIVVLGICPFWIICFGLVLMLRNCAVYVVTNGSFICISNTLKIIINFFPFLWGYFESKFALLFLNNCVNLHLTYVDVLLYNTNVCIGYGPCVLDYEKS